MKSPFLSFSSEENCEYLTSVCSVNSVSVVKAPVKGIDDSIEGKTVSKFFNTQLIIEEIKKFAQYFKIDISDQPECDLPKLLDKWLISENVIEMRIANRIAVKFGNRLGLTLLTLKTGLPENRCARDNWRDIHWDYWSQVENIILVGGLASGLLGRKLKEQIQYVFDVARVKPYNIILFDNGTYVGAMGCSTQIKNRNSNNLVFDFGQTNIKRCFVKLRNDQIEDMRFLKSMPSINMELGLDYDKAMELNKYLINILYDTYKEVSRHTELNDEIVISIASYTIGGVLNDERGGYAKLSLLGRNYANVLSDELSGRLHKNVTVKLIHDGTANALYFSDYENSVCLSIGTAFGVGFPETKV